MGTDEEISRLTQRLEWSEKQVALLRAEVLAWKARYEDAVDAHANAAVLRMCHEARMCNGVVDFSDPRGTGKVRRMTDAAGALEDK